MKETIERIIARTHKSHDMAYIGKGWLTEVLTEELSTLNPNRIDEERFGEIYSEYIKSLPLMPKWKDNLTFRKLLNLYNSTLKDHQVLQLLDDKVPAWFLPNHVQSFRIDTWNELRSHYGTPTKKELVSVEELMDEMMVVYNRVGNDLRSVVEHFHDTYSLNSTKREWWMDLKEGDKFMCGEIVHIFKKFHHLTKLYFSENYCVDISYCTPYIEPSTIDICKEKLGAELFEKFKIELTNQILTLKEATK